MDGLRRFLALTPGNPMNPVTLLVLGFFAVMLLGFPPVMLALGLGVGGTLFVTAVIVATAVLCVGLMVAIGRRYARDFERLLAGEHWVRWRLGPGERERFVVDEGTRTRREAKSYVPYAVGFAALGALVVGVATDSASAGLLGGAILGAVGLLVVVTTYLWGGAREREGARDLDEVYLGDLGIYQLGRYTPVRGFNVFLVGVEARPGDPAVLAFTIGSRGRYGTRTSEVRVAVPAGRETEAAELAERFRREFGLAR